MPERRCRPFHLFVKWVVGTCGWHRNCTRNERETDLSGSIKQVGLQPLGSSDAGTICC